MRALVLWLAATAGCYRPSIVSRQFSCSATDTRCPSGFTCDACQWLCVRSTETCHSDGGMGARDLAGADLASIASTDGADLSGMVSGADLAIAPDAALGPTSTLSFATDDVEIGFGASVVVTGDFNGDGEKDAFTGGGIILGARNAAPTWFAWPSPRPGREGATGDLDGDGRLDVITVDFGNVAGTVYVELNLGNSPSGVPSFSQTDIVFGALNEDVYRPEVVDLDGDGLSDIVVQTLYSQTGKTNASAFFGMGKGVFPAMPYDYPFTLGADLFAAADFAHLGRVDLLAVATAETNPASGMAIHYHNGPAGTARPMLFQSVDQLGAGGATGSLSRAVADFDGDGYLDLAVVGGGDGKLRLLLFGQLSPTATLPAFDTGGCGKTVVSGDFNRDGRPDVAVLQSCSSTVTVLLNQGGGSFGAPHELPLASSNGYGGLAAADLDGDGLDEIIVGQSDRMSVLRNTSR